MRPFRFGLIMTGLESRATWTEQAKLVEESGFAVLLVPDHFALPLAPVPAMLAAANATSSLRVGSYVLANDFRHPAVLVKEAATLDLLTEGRFELGLGAGWNRSEYRSAGIPFERGRVRLERLSEAVRIIKGAWEGGPVSHAGRHYVSDGIQCAVPVVQRSLPLLLGGGGRRLLSFGAREATIVGLMARARNGAIDLATLSDRATRQRIGWIREAAPDRFDELELNLFVHRARHTEDRVGAAEEIAREASLDPDLVLESPHYLLGTHAQMREQLLRLRENYGITYFAFFDRDRSAVAPVVAKLAA